jgi:hypothetical protein
MKLFPDKRITVELRNDRAATLNELKRNTKLSDKLVSDYTNKQFIGQVDDSGFKIISSEIGRGAVCVFIGEFQDSLGEIEIRIHNAFKILFLILMLMPIIGVGVSVVIQGIDESMEIVIPAILAILFIRFVLIELSFRFISGTGINKLTRVIGIQEVKRKNAGS